MIVRRIISGAVVAAFIALALSNAHQSASAAVINWGSAQNIVNASDVITTGSLFASANFYQASQGNITVNGVTFNGFQIPSQSTVVTVGNITLTGTSLQGLAGAGGPASYNGLLDQGGFLFTGSSSPTMTVGIGGLTNGAQYLIQYWVQDGRAGTVARTTLVGGKTLAANATQTVGGFGQYITGTFTADSATQSFSAVGGFGAVAYANAMQVRLLAVPEPSTWAMAGTGIAFAVTWGSLRRRRRIGSLDS